MDPTRDWPLASEHVSIASVAEAVRQCGALFGGGDTLVVCDFDGTLARRNADPWAARILPTAQRALRRLAGSPSVSVAFLSGRTVADLAERTRVGNARYLGDHGAESAEAARGFRLNSLEVQHASAPHQAVEMAAHLALSVQAEVDEDWLGVEKKAAAVAFHFRQAQDLEDARQRVHAAVDVGDPLGVMVRVPGARSLELRSEGAPTKTTTLESLVQAERPSAVLALGDDRNDAAAWDAVRGAFAGSQQECRAVAVAGYPDVTTDVAAHADFVLGSPDEAARFLDELSLLVRPGT
jgi:trehalose 6-phosphate phosphatase